jgi:hypothetical protein
MQNPAPSPNFHTADLSIARALVTTHFALSCVASCKGFVFEENREKLTEFSDFSRWVRFLNLFFVRWPAFFLLRQHKLLRCVLPYSVCS